MKKSSMKKSSLKNRITLLEAAVSAASNARDYWMREHERRVKALTRLQEKNKIAELKADAAANASDYWARQHELKRRLDEAENEIAELERRLADNGGLCTLRTKLTTETCQEALTRLQEKNKIAELKADAAANSRDYWMREHDLRGEELLEAKHRITLLEEDNERLRRLDNNRGLCALTERFGRKPKTVSILNLWCDDLQVVSGKTASAIDVETLTRLRDAGQADWFIDIDRRRKNHLWALATDKQMRALLKGALVFMDA